MNRPSFRPRPVDINKKLAIVRSTDELNAEDEGVSRTVHHGHIALDAENEQILPAPSKKGPSVEIPTPHCGVVEAYDKLYPANFRQPSSYIRSKHVRQDDGVYVEYDLDDEDEDWLEVLNQNRLLLAADRLEWMIYQMELLDARARAKAGTAMLAGAVDQTGAAGQVSSGGVRVPVLLQQQQAVDALRAQVPRQAIIAAAYDYWRSKRERWGKPILRRLQPSPAITDTNPFNVFRPRERAHRPNTRRREERKRELINCEVALQQAALSDREITVQQAEALGIIPDLSSWIPKPFPGATSEDQHQQQQQQQYQLLPPPAGTTITATSTTSTGAPTFATLGGLPPANHFDNILSVTRRRGSVGAAGIAAAGSAAAAAGGTLPGAAGGWAGWLPDAATVTSGPVTDAVSPLDHLLPLLKKKRRRQVVFPRGGRLSRVLRSAPPPDIPMPFTRSFSLEQLAALHIQPPLLSHRPPPVSLWPLPRDALCRSPLVPSSVSVVAGREAVREGVELRSAAPPAFNAAPATVAGTGGTAAPPSAAAAAAAAATSQSAARSKPGPNTTAAAAGVAYRRSNSGKAFGIGSSQPAAGGNAADVGGARGGVGVGGVQSGVRDVGGVRGGEGGVGVARGGVGAGAVRDGAAGSKAPVPGEPGVASPYMPPKQRSHAQRADKNV
ncbi:unnamed protein product [Closterium sp. NIES-64]|nr:unnamed protein product [Closterium sp. NIES-64]